jgi:hypothetical protein
LDSTEARYEKQLIQKLIGTFMEQMLVIGDQTTRRLLWAHILRLFGQVKLLDTKLAIQPSPGHFHAQMKLGACMSAHLDKKESKADAGTFRNLQDAIGRTNSMGKKWSAAYDANRRMWGDFTHVHSTGFAMEWFGLTNVAGKPTKNVPPANWDDLSQAEQKLWFSTQMKAICQKYFSWGHAWTERVHVPSPAEALATVTAASKKVHFCEMGCGKAFKYLHGKEFETHRAGCKGATLASKKVPQWVKGHKYPDDVYNYARRAWNEGMLFEVYEDMIRFNNGPKMNEILSKWMSPITFISSNKSHYTYEGLYVGAMTKFLLSPRMAHKMVWNGTCCGHARPGENQPCDHRMENVNRTGKECINQLGPQNISRVDLHKLGKTFLPLHDACLKFDRISRVPRASAYCSTRSLVCFLRASVCSCAWPFAI